MENQLTLRQISILRTLNGGENVATDDRAKAIREIVTLAPGLLVIVPRIGMVGPRPIFGAVLSSEGRQFLSALDAAKK